VMAWYDNEWGFSNRMLDNTLALMAASNDSLTQISESQAV
jgi:glyceraldehyde 3-phosphate dehydrogenase